MNARFPPTSGRDKPKAASARDKPAQTGHDEGPEGQQVCSARERIAQHALLSEHNQEDLTDALPEMIGALLAAALRQERDQLAYPRAENGQGGSEKQQEQGGAHPAAGR